MKYLIISLFLIGCTSGTEFGKCIGAFEEKNQTKVYKMSMNNIFWAIVGFELIYPPIKVILDETLCPIGIKNKE